MGALSRLFRSKPLPVQTKSVSSITVDSPAQTVINQIIAESDCHVVDEQQLRCHVGSLPAHYVGASYSSAAIRSHMAMLEEASALREGIPVIRLDVKNGEHSNSSAGSDLHRSPAAAATAACDSDVDDDDDDSSSAGLSLRSVDESLSVCRMEVTFACNSHVCPSALSSALRRAGMKAYGLTTYATSSDGTLGHFVLRASISRFSTRDIEDVFAAAAAPSAKHSSPHNSLSSSPTGSRAAPIMRAKAFPEALSNFVGKMSPLHHMHHLVRSSSAHGPAPAIGRLPRPMSPLCGSPTDANGLLQVLLSERRTMKKKLGALIIDSMELEVGPVIAVGASGEVRRGSYKGERVAVKVLKGEGRDAHAMVAEFKREVLTLMACGHCPELLKFVGVCVDAFGRMCIVTEFMPGGALSDLLRRRKSQGRPLAALEALKIARDVATGMAFLHRHGMMHRDLKSANILLGIVNEGAGKEEGKEEEKEGGQGRNLSNGGLTNGGLRAVVGDFGVARLKGERGDMTKEVGTYRWMAPEAFGTSSWPVTHKGDVYSFGIVLWELVTGNLPFADYSPLQAAVAVALNGARPPVPATCPEGLRSLMERCWDKTPKERPEFSEVVMVLDGMIREEEGK